MGQTAVATGSTVALFTVPAGVCNFVFYQTGPGTVYTGTSTAVTTTNGMQCPTIPGVPFDGYATSGGVTLYGCNTSGTVATVHYFISTIGL